MPTHRRKVEKKRESREGIESRFDWKCFVLRMRERRLDFMAALRVSAAFSEKEDGVLEGVALPRVVHDEAHLAAIFAGALPERLSAAGGCHH